MSTKQILLKFKNLAGTGSLGEKTLLSMLASLKKQQRRDPKSIVATSLRRLRSGLTIRPQIRAGKVIYLPSYLSENAMYFYSIGWLFKAARVRNRKVIVSKNLALEVVETLERRGLAVKSKFDLTKAIRGCRVNLQKQYKHPIKHASVYYSNTFQTMRSKRLRSQRYFPVKEKNQKINYKAHQKIIKLQAKNFANIKLRARKMAKKVTSKKDL